MGLRFEDPITLRGKFLSFFNLNLAPNLLKGSAILLKSLFYKLLSPINFIGCVVLIKKPKISLPSVPEFLASIIIFFL